MKQRKIEIALGQASPDRIAYKCVAWRVLNVWSDAFKMVHGSNWEREPSTHLAYSPDYRPDGVVFDYASDGKMGIAELKVANSCTSTQEGRSTTTKKTATCAFAGTLPQIMQRLLGRPGASRLSTTGKIPDYSRCVDMGHHLIVLVHEVFGGMSPSAVAALKRMARAVNNTLSDRYARQATWTAKSFEAFVAQRLSAAVARWVAKELIDGAKNGGGRTMHFDRAEKRGKGSAELDDVEEEEESEEEDKEEEEAAATTEEESGEEDKQEEEVVVTEMGRDSTRAFLDGLAAQDYNDNGNGNNNYNDNNNNNNNNNQNNHNHNDEMNTDDTTKAAGNVCVGNSSRGPTGSGAAPAGFLDVGIHRGTALGNPFPMGHNGRDERLREEVCEACDALLVSQLEAQVVGTDRGLEWDSRFAGPQAKSSREAALDVLEGRLRNGESLRLMCWCAPKRCHGDGIARLLVGRVAGARLFDTDGTAVVEGDTVGPDCTYHSWGGGRPAATDVAGGDDGDAAMGHEPTEGEEDKEGRAHLHDCAEKNNDAEIAEYATEGAAGAATTGVGPNGQEQEGRTDRHACADKNSEISVALAIGKVATAAPAQVTNQCQVSVASMMQVAPPPTASPTAHAK